MFKMQKVVLTTLLCSLSGAAWAEGGVFVTGHDPDYHSVYSGGAQHIIQKAISFVTNGKANPSILLVTDTVSPGGDNVDSRLGMQTAGFTFDVADDGSAGGSVLNASTVNFSNYDVVVIASDYGGWLRQSELSDVVARSGNLISYVNGGGGLVAFSESGTNQATNSADYFKFLPFLVSSSQKNQSEVGNTLTPFGMSLGLTDSDVNGNASHSVFTSTGGMNIVDLDSSGQILSLAFRGQIGVGGVTPEPGVFALLGAGLLTGGVFLRRRRIA